jgi:hypothetical protein
MFLIHLIIILVVALLFLHIRYQLRVNNSLEIYEIDYTTNSALQISCDVRLPVIFDAPREFRPLDINKLTKTQLAHDANTFSSGTNTFNPTKVTLQSALTLAQGIGVENTDDIIFSERNCQLIDDADLTDFFADNDEFLNPNFSISRSYDVLFGAQNSTTPLQYHINGRRFYYVSQGKLTVKFAPWKFEKYLHPCIDYKNLRFHSAINPWNVQKEYKDDADRVKFIDVEIPTGKILYIPPYIWFSFSFQDEVLTQNADNVEEKQSSMTVPAVVQNFTYQTPINIAAITPVLLRHQIENFL